MDGVGSPCSLSELDLGGEGQAGFKAVSVTDDAEDGEEMSTASLAEVLASRGGKFLQELELWALCRECCLTLEYVHDCHDLFQTLCISPDTVAFDPDGNVCFLDLDMEPEAVYVSPESTEYGEHSFKSHLFSLGMTLLFATEYNTGSDDPRAEISDTFTDLLTSLTHDDSQLRPDLDTVIEACEKALGAESSQDICLGIVGLQAQSDETQGLPEKQTGSSSIQQMTDELSAYLQSQSGLVDSKSIPSSDAIESERIEDNKEAKKDVNDNTVEVKSKETRKKGHEKREKLRSKQIVRDASFDEEDSMLSDLEDLSARRQKGIMLKDLLSAVDRELTETELWSLCRESVLTLQRKKKQLPSYISLDTLMVRDSGTISFKAIPEDKALEVIYMAPELQTKGVLNEKTCLYGLGVTLQRCAGGKDSASQALPDSETLQILLTSFLQLNQHKRPTLDTALEMCEQYQKVQETRSRAVCQAMYREALEAVMTKSEGSSQEPASKNSWDESEMEQTTMVSTDNTFSMAQAGDTTEAEDNIDDIPYDDDQDDTNPAAGTAFKTLMSTSEVKGSQVQSTSAFKPVAVKAKPARKLERVPSAFSSPATHFKPIVIQDKGDDAEDKSDSGKEKGVVSKLREIKDNLQRHRGSETAVKESKNVSLSKNNDDLSSSQEQREQSQLNAEGQTSSQSQSQETLPNTDALASAIASYLKSHLSGGIPSALNNLPQTNVHNHSNQTATADAPPFLGSQSQHHFAVPSMNSSGFSSFPNNARTVPSSATSITMSTYSSSSSSPMYSHNQYIPVSYSPGSLPVQRNTLQANTLPATNMAPMIGHYPPPFPGLNQMPVQFTLVQDPVTGLMQMVPCVIPMPSQPQPSPSNTVPGNSVQEIALNADTSDRRSEEKHRTKQGEISSLHADPSVEISDNSSLPRNNQPISKESNTTTDSVHISTQLLPNPQGNREKISPSSSKVGDRTKKLPNKHLNPSKDAGNDNDSQTSSPSPSKDSGICVSQQAQAASYSKDTLMERLLSSHDSQRQRTLSQVLRIIREEFADDGVFDSGVEDLAIAEYILSLSSLTWETFRCAITEKFFHLVWTYDLLSVLYEAVGGSPSPQFRNNPKTPPTVHSNQVPYDLYIKADGENNSRFSDINRQDFQGSYKPLSQDFRDSYTDATNRPATSGEIALNTRSMYTASHVVPVRSPDNSQYQQRPRSEVGGRRGLWSETSDSTDTESRDKRRRFKKRGELDKSKSSSLHNISIATKPFEQYDPVSFEQSKIDDQTDGGTREIAQNAPQMNRSSGLRFKSDTESPISNSGADNYNSRIQNITHPPSIGSHTPILRAAHHNNHTPRYMDPRVSAMSHSSSKPDSSSENSQSNQIQTSPRHPHGGFSPRVPDILPSKPSKLRSNQYSASHLLPNRNYAGSSSSSSPNDQQTGRLQTLPTSQHNSLPSTNAQPYKVTSTNYSSNDDEADLQRSAEMRRLAAKKPELFQDTRSSKASLPQEKVSSKQILTNSSDTNSSTNLSYNGQVSTQKRPSSSQNQNAPNTNFSNTNNRYSVPEHMARDRMGNTLSAPSKNSYFTNSMSALPSYELSTPAAKTRNDYMSVNKNSNSNYSNNNGSSCNNNQNNLSQPAYGRSLSAVYTRRHQPLETGVVVTDSARDSSDGSLHQGKGHHRRGSDGSVHLPELNSALLPYSNKGQIVYHSAMIQLSLTSEVDEFIHSIDEENKRAIEARLASVKQEINVQQRQRKKTQRFYRKLNEQSGDGKSSKGDQAISEQMLKDMTDMTRKISFLQLCQTHLQMLLAELYGLDSCFLYSLAAAEPGQALVLRPVEVNQYLQFRTVSTVEAGQMSVLQAGTPRGLMSYLYTSSALSDGYIHQFLICFRYILTAEQLLSFILEKYRSAQSHHSDLNLMRVLRRSMDLLHVWLEGYYSIDFSNNKRLLRKLADFLTEQNEAKVDGAEELFSLYAACRMGDHAELMLATEMDEDEEEGATYFLHLTNPKRWESFRSLLRRSKSEKSSAGSSGKSRSDFHNKPLGGLQKPVFDLADCPAYTLAEQLTLLEQEIFRKCHPVHFLNSQCQGVGVALSIPGLRTPSMSRKMDPAQATKKGLFVSDPPIESYIVYMISHSQEVSHWVAAEVLSCGSNKSQTNMITKFLNTGHLCLEVKNFATGLAILEGLENLVVRQLPVWKNITSKYMAYLDEMTKAKMKVKGEALALMSEKDCHVFPTIPSALFLALHLQQAEIGGFTLANGMFKWDKMRCISEILDQARIFRDHEYGFRPEADIQRALKRRLEDFSDQDLHTVASSQDNNFRRHSSSSSLSGTLKKVKDKFGSRKK